VNPFTTDHPLVSQPREHLLLARIFTRRALILALISSVVAEGLSVAALFLCPDNALPASFSKSFHGPAASFAAFLLPEMIDDDASKTQEYIFIFIVFAVAWFQWFVIFFVVFCPFLSGGGGRRADAANARRAR
jgi:hypothetical protein